MSWEETVRRPDIDAVDICTPGDLHLPVAMAAAAAGKAVLCEKPLARDLAEAQEMLAAVRKAGVVHMLCHNYRRVPALALARELIDRRRPGAAPRVASAASFTSAPSTCTIAASIRSAPRTWRHDKARAGSGALGDLGSHVIDLARFLVGEIAEVSGTLQTFIGQRTAAGAAAAQPVDVDDAALALFRFENGAIGSFEVSRFGMGRKNHARIEVSGDRGAFVFDLETPQRARALRRGRAAERLPHRAGHAQAAPVHRGVVAAGPSHRL